MTYCVYNTSNHYWMCGYAFLYCLLRQQIFFIEARRAVEVGCTCKSRNKALTKESRVPEFLCLNQSNAHLVHQDKACELLTFTCHPEIQKKFFIFFVQNTNIFQSKLVGLFLHALSCILFRRLFPDACSFLCYSLVPPAHLKKIRSVIN